MLDPTSLDVIGKAVSAAEQRTAGEIAVVVADKSAGYTGARAVFALALATLVELGAVALWVDVDARLIAAATPVLLVLGFLLGGAPPVLRALLRDADVDVAVARAAHVAFVERGVHRTRDRAGVLVYLSLLERRVHILGDAGIHAVVKDDGWRGHVARIVEAMGKGDAAGVARVVEDIGAVLGQTFPRRADDQNELPDAVTVQRR